MSDLTPEMVAAFNRYASHRDSLDRYGYQGATTADRRKYTRLLNKALDTAQKGTTGSEDPVFRERWNALSRLYDQTPKANPRPRKYASASERQAAYRARAPEVCFRAEAKTVETLDRIAETLDQSRADVLLSMTKFALANHDWARFGLTHKPLPFEYGVNPVEKFTPSQLNALRREWSTIKRVDPASPTYKELVKYLNGLPQGMLEQLADARPAIPFVSGMALNRVKRKTNPMKTTRAKRKPTPAQLAARERFAEMARSGAFKKGAKRKKNPTATSDLDAWMNEYRQLEDINAHSENVVRLADLVGTKADQSAAREILERQQRVGFLQPADYEKRSKLNAKLWPKLMRLMNVRKTNPAKKTVSQKISQLTREGYPQKQAVAVALSEERAGKVRRNPAKAPSTVYQVQYTKDGKAWAVWGTYDTAEKAKAIAKGGSDSIYPGMWWRVESIKVKA